MPRSRGTRRRQQKAKRLKTNDMSGHPNAADKPSERGRDTNHMGSSDDRRTENPRTNDPGHRKKLKQLRAAVRELWQNTRKEMVTAGFWVNLAVAVGTIGLGLIALKSMTDTNATTANQIALAKADQRAWVGVEIKPYGDLAFNGGGGRIALSYRLINGGRSIATYALVLDELRALPVQPAAYGGTRISMDYNFNCVRDPEKQKNVGTVVLPGNPVDQGSFDVEIPRANIATYQQADGSIALELIGCVTYFTPVTNEEPHSTGFVYIVERPQTTGQKFPVATPGTVYGPNDYLLARMPGNAAAN